MDKTVCSPRWRDWSQGSNRGHPDQTNRRGDMKTKSAKPLDSTQVKASHRTESQ